MIKLNEAKLIKDGYWNNITKYGTYTLGFVLMLWFYQDSYILILISVVLLLINVYMLLRSVIGYLIVTKYIRFLRQKIFDENMKGFRDTFSNFRKNNQKTNNNSDNRYKEPKNIKPDKVANAYKLLKLDVDSNIIEIKKRYRELASVWHPDKFVNNTDENKSISNKNMLKLNNAYDLIKKDKNFK